MSLLPSQHPAAKAIVIALITAVYFVAGKIGLGFASLNVSPSPVWIPAGIAIALLLMFGISTWPAILAGAFLVNITTAGSPLVSAGIIAIGNTLEAMLGAALLHRYAHG